MKSIRTLAVLVAVFLSATAAQANDNWRIVESAGAVKAGGAGFTPAAVKSDQILPANAWVETAGTGRVVLVRGLESIAVGPNSRVQLPSLEVNGNTQVLQTLGSAFYQIGKQQKPHFQVDTPYLAAVVKGTTFTVTVDEGVASVQVTEGLVEVATPDRADVEFVRPGFTGVVSHDHKGDVVVVQSERGAAPPVINGKSKDKSTSVEPRGKLASAGAPGMDRVVIAHAIGEAKVDVKAATGGLAHNAVEPTAATKDSKAKLGNDNAVTKTATGVVASVGNVLTDVAGGARSENAATPATPAIPAVPAIDVALGPVDVSAGGNGNGVGLGVGLGVGNGNGGGAAPDLGGNGGGNGVGVGVGLGVGNGNSGGNGNGNGGVGVDLDVGAGAGGVGVGVGVGNGNGNGGGLGLGLGLGGGKGLLGLGR